VDFKKWNILLHTCFTICITVLIMQSIEQQSQINKFYKEFDNINKLSIEESYMGYIEQFIADDFEAIASYFSPPVSFNGNIAETKEDVINHYKNMKANIQDGYAYSVVDKIKVYSPKGDDSYLLCSEFTRYNSNDEIIFEGAANYIYEQPISSFKMKSLEMAYYGCPDTRLPQ